MNTKKLSLFGLLAFAIFSAVLFTSCNENAKTTTTTVVDTTNMKNGKKVIDTTAKARPLVPGG